MMEVRKVLGRLQKYSEGTSVTEVAGVDGRVVLGLAMGSNRESRSRSLLLEKQ